VYHGGGQGADKGLCHRCYLGYCDLRPTCETCQTDSRLPDEVRKVLSSILPFSNSCRCRWSGITAEALANVTTTHAQVQEHIMKLLSPSAPTANPFSMPASTSTSTVSKPTESPPPTPILLGHSLESDLKALKICHPRCIDTALLYHHPRGRPLKPGLAWLTKKWCGREIQMRGEGGHDPEEDARACLDLLKKKLECGPGFGEFKIDHESIFERMGRAGSSRANKGSTVKTAVVDHGNPAVMHGSKASTAIACKNDDEVLEGLLSVIPAHQFTFGRYMGLANALGCMFRSSYSCSFISMLNFFVLVVGVTPKASPDAPIVTQPISQSGSLSLSPSELAPILSQLNQHLKSLHAALPTRTALVIFTGHSDPRQMSALNARKNAFEGAIKSGKAPEEITAMGLTWTTSDARNLEEAVELARRGLVFLGIKQ